MPLSDFLPIVYVALFLRFCRCRCRCRYRQQKLDREAHQKMKNLYDESAVYSAKALRSERDSVGLVLLHGIRATIG